MNDISIHWFYEAKIYIVNLHQNVEAKTKVGLLLFLFCFVIFFNHKNVLIRLINKWHNIFMFWWFGTKTNIFKIFINCQGTNKSNRIVFIFRLRLQRPYHIGVYFLHFVGCFIFSYRSVLFASKLICIHLYSHVFYQYDQSLFYHFSSLDPYSTLLRWFIITMNQKR